MNQLKWGVVLSYLSMGLGVLISLVYTPFMLRLLGQSEWGLYQLVASVAAYLSLLNFGFGSAYIRFYTRASVSGCEDEVARLNGMFLTVFLVIGAVALLAGAVLMANIGAVFGDKLTAAELDKARILMGLMTLTVAVSFPASVFGSFVLAHERFFFNGVLSVVRMAVTPAVTLFILFLGQKAVGMAVVACVIAIAHAIITAWYCVKRMKMTFMFAGMDLLLMKEVAIFSSYIFINMIVNMVNWNVDKLIVGRFLGTAAVAVYALAAQVNGYYMTLSTSVASMFVPRVHRLVAESDDDTGLTHLLTRVGRIQFLILALVCSALVVFGQPFIVAWAGPDYIGAYPILLVLIVPFTVDLITNLSIEIMRAKNMHQFRSWLYLGMAVVNVAISIPLARLYGGVGAAVGTGVALFVGNGVIMNIYCHRRVGLDMVYFWRRIGAFVPALVPSVLAGAAIMVFVEPQGAAQLVAWGAAYVAVYCASMWFFGMNESERDLISKPVASGLGRLRAAVR